MKQRLTVLGSTGSIGTSTLDVVRRHPDQFEVFALSAATQVDALLAQCQAFTPRYAVMASAAHAAQLAEKLKQNNLKTEVLQAPDALETIASHAEVNTVMGAIVGAAGLAPCLAAARAGKRLLLANKEALVVGGALFMQTVQDHGCTLLPIDSEHSAIFQCLPEERSTWAQRVHSIILTASGGPFRQRDPATLGQVTPAQACKHPNFSMGRKISVDSATMMNKALEVIEARYLFGVSPDQLDVVIHPQSVIHSMVQYRDTSVVAQLGTPDMRVPIAYGLSWPERIESGAGALDFRNLQNLTFEPIDGDGHRERYPGLALAWESLRGESGSCAVLNAANEVAVAAFLERQIRFDQIHAVNRATLDEVQPNAPDGLEALLDLDARARAAALATVRRLAA